MSFDSYDNKEIIVNDKYVGKVVKTENNMMFVRLFINSDYKDSIINNRENIKNSNIIREIYDLNDGRGYKVITRDSNISVIDDGEIIKNALNVLNRKDVDISVMINKINKITKEICVKNDEKILEKEDSIPSLFIDEDLLNRIFNDKVSVYTRYYDMYQESFSNLNENAQSKIKELVVEILSNQEQVNVNHFLDLKNMVIFNDGNREQNLLFYGKMIIEKLIENLNEFQSNLKSSNGEIITLKDNTNSNVNVMDVYGLFDFLEFKIVNEFVEITNKNLEKKNVVTKELIDLEYSSFGINNGEQIYDNKINYLMIASLFSSINEKITTFEKEIILQAKKILRLDFVIGFQPKLNLMVFILTRLILCWFGDSYLYENIYKIKVLIDFNKSVKNDENFITPLISLSPYYNKKEEYYKMIGYMSLYFFNFKNYGSSTNNKPTYFKAIDNEGLLYCINVSPDMKRYIEILKLQNLNKLLGN